jgi:hypothetical protein
MYLILHLTMLPSHAATSTDETQRDRQRNERYTNQLHRNDVLLGRGVPVFNYSGNRRFRQIISEFKPRYSAASKHQLKNNITREIIDVIENSNGRFVREVKTSAEAASLGIPQGMKAWALVDDDAKVLKVKQALREPNLKEDYSETQQEPEQQILDDTKIATSHQHMRSDLLATCDENPYDNRNLAIESLFSYQPQFNMMPTISTDPMPSSADGQLDSDLIFRLLLLREQQREISRPGNTIPNGLALLGQESSSYSFHDNQISQANSQHIEALLASRLHSSVIYPPESLATMEPRQSSSLAIINELTRRHHQSEAFALDTARTREPCYLDLLSRTIQSGNQNLPFLFPGGNEVITASDHFHRNLESSYFNLSDNTSTNDDTQFPNDLLNIQAHLPQGDRRAGDHILTNSQVEPVSLDLVPVETPSSSEGKERATSRKRMPHDMEESSAYPSNEKKRS